MGNWRGDLNAIAAALGVAEEGNWRADLKRIREAVEAGGGGGGGGMTPAQVQALIDSSLASFQAATSNIANSAVTNAKIANGTITSAKLASPGTSAYALTNGSWMDIANIRPTLYVDFQSTQTQANGSQLFPFKTLQAAINASTFGDVIIVGPGESQEDITITTDNLTIVTEGADGQYRAEIDGSITIASTSQRIGLYGLFFTGTLNIETETGLVYPEKCDFGGLQVPDTFAGYTRFLHCFFEGSPSINAGADGLIDFQFCQWENGSTLDVASGNVIIYGGRQVLLNHTGGAVYVYGDTQFIANSSGVAITSSAAFSATNALFLLSGTTFTAAGTFATISKTGTCAYGIGHFIRGASADTLTGTRVDSSLKANDVFANFTPTSYTPTDNSVIAHLQGLDASIPVPLVATVCPATTVVFAFSADGSTFSFTGGTFLWMSSKGNYGTAVFGAQINIPYITGRVIILDVSNPNAPVVSSRSVNNITFSPNEYVIGNMFNVGTTPLTRTVTVYGSGAYTWSATAGHHEAYGDISSSGATLDLTVGDYIIRASYSTPTAASISVHAANGTLTNIDIRRWSTYGSTSEGTNFDDYTLTTAGVVVDDTVLLDSSDTCMLWIASGRQMIEVRVFISGGGTRCRILSDYLSD